MYIEFDDNKEYMNSRTKSWILSTLKKIGVGGCSLGVPLLDRASEPGIIMLVCDYGFWDYPT